MSMHQTDFSVPEVFSTPGRTAISKSPGTNMVREAGHAARVMAVAGPCL